MDFRIWQRFPSVPPKRSFRSENRYPRTVLDGGAIRAAIEAERMARGWSRKRFAYEVGSSPARVSRIASGLRVLRVSVAAAWAQMIGCEPTLFVRAALQDQVTAGDVAMVVRVEETT